MACSSVGLTSRLLCMRVGSCMLMARMRHARPTHLCDAVGDAGLRYCRAWHVVNASLQALCAARNEIGHAGITCCAFLECADVIVEVVGGKCCVLLFIEFDTPASHVAVFLSVLMCWCGLWALNAVCCSACMWAAHMLMAVGQHMRHHTLMPTAFSAHIHAHAPDPLLPSSSEQAGSRLHWWWGIA